MSNLQLRVISSVILVIAVLVVTWLGGLPFRLLAVAIGAAIFYEWCAMSPTVANQSYQLLSGLFLSAALIAVVAGLPAQTVLLVFASALIVSTLVGLIRGQGMWTTTGLGYAGFSAISLAFLRDDDGTGLVAILFLFATVWATDITAYFVGRAVGGPKLAPSISPGKTWSGAVGGTVGGIVAGLAVAALAGGSSLLSLAFVTLLLAVISQLGDLFESWVKRRHGVKDSGALIPGHGGVMDRVDGLVAAAFALYVIRWIVGGG